MKVYIGPYRSEIYETVLGFIITGYWYAGGPEGKPYYHRFYGAVCNNWTFGLGIYKEDCF